METNQSEICPTCNGTKEVEVMNGPDDFETVTCPDCVREHSVEDNPNEI